MTFTARPAPMRPLVLAGPKGPCTRIRSYYEPVELRTARDLYLVDHSDAQNLSKTMRCSLTVTRASDGRTVSYDRVISKICRTNGEARHEISVPGFPTVATLTEACELVLRDAADRWERQ